MLNTEHHMLRNVYREFAVLENKYLIYWNISWKKLNISLALMLNIVESSLRKNSKLAEGHERGGGVIKKSKQSTWNKVLQQSHEY